MAITIISCGKSLENHLAEGLSSIEQTRLIGHTFKENYTIDKMAFLKEGDQTYSLIFKLSEDSKKELIEQYSLGIHVFAKGLEGQKINNKKKKNKINWDFKPIITVNNDYKYVINQIETPIKRIDSMRLFLYDRDKYKKKTYGKAVWIKNIGL